MKKPLLLSIGILFCNFLAYAQRYETGIGQFTDMVIQNAREMERDARMLESATTRSCQELKRVAKNQARKYRTEAKRMKAAAEITAGHRKEDRYRRRWHTRERWRRRHRAREVASSTTAATTPTTPTPQPAAPTLSLPALPSPDGSGASVSAVSTQQPTTSNLIATQAPPSIAGAPDTDIAQTLTSDTPPLPNSTSNGAASTITSSGTSNGTDSTSPGTPPSGTDDGTSNSTESADSNTSGLTKSDQTSSSD